MRAQMEQTFQNLDRCLKAAGATWADVVKTNTFVTDLDESIVEQSSAAPLTQWVSAFPRFNKQTGDASRTASPGQSKSDTGAPV